MILLVPADVLHPRRVDEHFAPEAKAARAVGLEVALVDHDALARPGGAEEAVRRVRGSGSAVYRGWMLTADRYADFAEALLRRGVVVRTSAEQYRRAHELPEWYADLAEVTPRSVWTVGADRGAFDRARVELGGGPAVLRDYCKSMKHHWDEAAYIPDLADADAAWAVAARFRELRDEDMVGGFVLRRFEELAAAEVRTWWVDGECLLVGAHPDTPDELPAGFDLGGAGPLVAGLGVPFVTADFARRADGVWRLVEVGDGQVSDRPRTLGPDEFLSALAKR
ncbi:ATP-grasp domain-containing protein [Actinokineospora sp. PR83]|uniref:ATP-grasp domain-containing protein n=1 Tax=Actinokineospora sp. PR83 TaxID=2884908 RepID=UPI001F48CD2C|nr:ATP-grasp domain-containing protein [Actinokineospora sp. PR83]MCG8918478.1 ATP-grasp domain-containing protein [Actinokineospora sp. PR83]